MADERSNIIDYAFDSWMLHATEPPMDVAAAYKDGCAHGCLLVMEVLKPHMKELVAAGDRSKIPMDVVATMALIEKDINAWQRRSEGEQN